MHAEGQFQNSLPSFLASCETAAAGPSRALYKGSEATFQLPKQETTQRPGHQLFGTGQIMQPVWLGRYSDQHDQGTDWTADESWLGYGQSAQTESGVPAACRGVKLITHSNMAPNMVTTTTMIMMIIIIIAWKKIVEQAKTYPGL